MSPMAIGENPERVRVTRKVATWNPDRIDGGWGRNRTGIDGFAGRCITTLPPSLGGM